MGYMFGSLSDYEDLGLAVNIDDSVKIGVPTIVVLSMDYEEL